MRRFWRGDGGQLSEFATRLAGSSDLYEQSGRRPYASINFVTAHDGFSLQDLVSHNHKHNEANGESNHDVENNNLLQLRRGGPVDRSDDRRGARAAEAQLHRNATRVPGRTDDLRGRRAVGYPRGNNNPYCHDNALSWLDWTPAPEKRPFLEFPRKLIELRAKHPVLRRRRFFHGRAIRGVEVKDLAWFDPAGHDMTDDTWSWDCHGRRRTRQARRGEAGSTSVRLEPDPTSVTRRSCPEAGPRVCQAAGVNSPTEAARTRP